MEAPAVQLDDGEPGHLDVRSLAAAGRAVIVVLHDLSLAAARADRIAIVQAGRIVSIGAPAEVLTPERVEQVYGIKVHVLTGPTVIRSSSHIVNDLTPRQIDLTACHILSG